MPINNTRNLQRNSPALFRPIVVRNVQDQAHESVSFNLYEAKVISDTSIDNTSSFRYNDVSYL